MVEASWVARVNGPGPRENWKSTWVGRLGQIDPNIPFYPMATPGKVDRNDERDSPHMIQLASCSFYLKVKVPRWASRGLRTLMVS